MSRAPKQTNRFLTVRAVAIALVALGLLDIALRAVPVLGAFPDDFRFPKVTTMGFEDFVRYIAREDGVRVAVVGDSVTQGLFVDRDETMPAYLDAGYADQDRDVHAYNLGISAAHGNDMFAEVSHLVDREAADVVVIVFSYHFFLPQSGDADWDLRYPQLWRDPGVFDPFADDPLVTRYTRSDAVAEPWTDKVARSIGRVWKLYGSRDAYAAALLEKTAPEALKDAAAREVFGKTPAPVGHPRLEDYDRDRLAQYFDGRRLDTASAQMRYLRLALAKARDAGVPAVVVATPLDTSVTEHFGLLSKAEYADEMAKMREFVESEGATFADIGDDFPYETLADTIHPMAPGYLEMARRTERIIEPFVADAERRRVDER